MIIKRIVQPVAVADAVQIKERATSADAGRVGHVFVAQQNVEHRAGGRQKHQISFVPSRSVGRASIFISVGLCGTLRLCGEKILKSIHHRDAENRRACTEKTSSSATEARAESSMFRKLNL